MCFVLISKQTATFALCSSNRLIFYHRCGECSLSVRTEPLYKTASFVCKGECRRNDMIVMYTVMSALPVTLCSSSVCGTVFKFILRPCYIHLVGSVAVNGHHNVVRDFSRVIVQSVSEVISKLFPAASFHFVCWTLVRHVFIETMRTSLRFYDEEYKLGSFSLCNIHPPFPVWGKNILSRALMWRVETKTGWTFL
jgi:hypothetical protein